MVATLLIAVIGTVTWVKTVNYSRAAVAVGTVTDPGAVRDLQSNLDLLDRAIELAPDVAVYYQYRASTYWSFLKQEAVGRERACGLELSEGPYRACLAQQIYETGLRGIKQRPLDHNARLDLAVSEVALAGIIGEPGLIGQAAQLAEQVTQMVPKSWAAWNYLAEIQIRAGQYQAALNSLDKSLAITGDGPQSKNAVVMQAAAYRRLGQLERALQRLAVAIDIAPRDPGVYYDTGAIHHELGNFQEAVDQFGRAIKLDARYANAYYGRGATYNVLEEPQDALEDLNRAIGLNPENGLFYVRRADTFNRLGRFLQALEDLEDAIRLNPQEPMAYATRALTRTHLGKDAEAAADIQKATELGADIRVLLRQIEEAKGRR